MVVEHHFDLGNCSQKEKEFLLSNVFNYVIPHFYIIWKILKNPPVGRPIVAGFLLQLLYLSDIFWRNLTVNLIPFTMIAWVLLNFWNSNVSIKTVFCLPSTSKVYTQTVDDAMNSIKQLCYDFQNVIPNAHFIIELLESVLNSSFMTFDGKYFQQIFGLIMGTNVAPILTNIYMAMLENELKAKCKTDPKLIWPILFKRYWWWPKEIEKTSLNLLDSKIQWKTVQVDKYNWGIALD